jgi:hypothetical protein
MVLWCGREKIAAVDGLCGLQLELYLYVNDLCFVMISSEEECNVTFHYSF